LHFLNGTDRQPTIKAPLVGAMRLMVKFMGSRQLSFAISFETTH
jgi:hypothetical protein